MKTFMKNGAPCISLVTTPVEMYISIPVFSILSIQLMTIKFIFKYNYFTFLYFFFTEVGRGFWQLSPLSVLEKNM